MLTGYQDVVWVPALAEGAITFKGTFCGYDEAEVEAIAKRGKLVTLAFIIHP